jgi:short-subunit dehydrogenase
MSSDFVKKYGPWAIVAGASEGLGAAFAEALAARGANLLLLARRGGLLDRLAQDLRGRYAIEVRCVAVDLACADLAGVLQSLTADLDIGLAVYNAAFAPIGEFASKPLEDLLRVVDVNIRGPLIFARTLAPVMIARAKNRETRGGLVLMSSLAGFQGSPRMAAYVASKAFAIVFGESLWRELRPHGVDVVVSAAGAVRTPGYAKVMSGTRDPPGTLDASVVAEQTLAALGRGAIVIPGAFNRFARFLLGRLFSRRAAIAIMDSSTKELS